MKIFFVSLVLISGCSPQFLFYSSQSSIPHQSASIISEMKLITIEEQKFNLGVIAAKDKYTEEGNKLIYYILIAPGNSLYLNEIEDVNVTFGGTIFPEKVKELIKGLDEIIINWDKNYSDLEGFFYNFYSAPEHEIEPVSSNVSIWNPSVEFNFYNMQDKKLATIIIGKGEFKRIYYVDNLTVLKNFQTLLNIALQELSKMGYKS